MLSRVCSPRCAARASLKAASIGLPGNSPPGRPVVCISTSRMFMGRSGFSSVTEPSSATTPTCSVRHSGM